MGDQTLKLQRCLQKFIDHVDQLLQEDDPAGNGFHREYRVLRDLTAKNKEEDVFPATHGKLPYNVKKNRYRDIVPYDSTRVKLEVIPDSEGSDYINASFIEGANGRASYVASQGPLPHTLNDFWRMVWEYRVKVIIMACKELEMGKKKCACYWPENADQDLTFNNITVKLVSQNNLADADDCIERCMDVYRDDEGPLRVTQFHYTGWPDHGIPDDVDVILGMIAKMRAIRQRDPDFSPSVVHCSAGCGRTGTICAIDYTWELLKTGKLDDKLSLYDIIKNMREQRQSMIQTPEQYMMAHLATKDLFIKHSDVIQENVYANVGETEEYYNEGIGKGDSKTAGSSEYEDLSDMYSYAEPKKLLEQEVLSAVEIYTNPSTEITNTKPPLSPKPKPEETKKESPQTKRSSVTLSPKDQKKNSPIAVKRTSIKKVDPKKEHELTQGKSSEVNSHPLESYTNVFLGDRYTNVDVPVNPPGSESIPPPKPPLKRNPSIPKNTIDSAMVGPKSNESAFAGGPKFTLLSSAGDIKSTGRPAGGPKNTAAPSTGGPFVSHITIGSGGQAKNMPSGVNKVSNTNEQKSSLQQQPTYSLASSSNTVQSHKREDSGPSFVQSHQNTSTPQGSRNEQFQNQAPGGAVYAEVIKSKSNPKLSKSLPTPSSNSAGQNLGGGGNSTYEAIGTNGEYRPRPSSTSTSRVYEDVPDTLVDGLYSVAEPVNTSSDAPPIPDRGYVNDGDNKDQTRTMIENPGTFGRIKDKFFKGGSSDANLDTSNIPGFKKRLGKTPKGKREKPSLWDKIKL